jgi:hypothetical protein
MRTYLFLLPLLSSAPCLAQVEDNAKLFKPKTIEEANKRIEKIREETGKQVRVVTFAKIRGDPTKLDLNLEDAGHRKKLFSEWAQDDLKKLDDFKGIHILICQEPLHIEITITDDINKSMFSKRDRERLYKRLLAIQPDNPDQTFRRKTWQAVFGQEPNPDDGLLSGISYIEYNLWRPVDQTRWYIGLSVIGALLGVWLFLAILRARLRKRTPAETGVHGADESGRSIGVLGGGIGAVSGQWFYDRLFAPPPQAPASVGAESTMEKPSESKPPTAEDSFGAL